MKVSELSFADYIHVTIVSDCLPIFYFRTHNRRVMDTARCVRRRRKSCGLLSVPGSSPTSGNESCESIAGSSNRSSIYLSDDSYMESEADSSYG